MQTKKRKLTPEELSKIRSEAGKKGGAKRKLLGYAGVGRKKGWTKDPSLKSVPVRTITVREPDYQVFVKLAFAANLPIVEFMHRIAEKMRERNQKLIDDPPVVKFED